ncbi:GerMN domain-containing protein [Paenibacillus sp. HN-1]|nr:GerMN domain-containing protein [Paenibacillus sp. CGMCC 1.18879]MBY9083574.1 GerMN domain-containing protein [Paenibacillus sinensis]
MNKKIGVIGIASALLLVLGGCGDKPAAAPDEGGISTPTVVSGADSSQEPSASPEVSAPASASPQPSESEASPSQAPASAAASPSASTAPEAEKQNQTISVYYTDQQVTELKEAKAQIRFAQDTDKYTEAFKALQNSDSSDLISLWGKMELKSLKFENGQIVMDIHKPDEAQLGAGGESFALSALTKTLFQFPEVKSIELLVDGQQVESLMGHADLLHPMTRDNMAD